MTDPITHAQWIAEGTRRFGSDPSAWRLVCPVCKHVAAVKDWTNAGAPVTAAGFSCVGRWTGGRDAFEGRGKGPCTYAGGGLFKLNPLAVLAPDGEIHHVFDFAEVA